MASDLPKAVPPKSLISRATIVFMALALIGVVFAFPLLLLVWQAAGLRDASGAIVQNRIPARIMVFLVAFSPLFAWYCWRRTWMTVALLLCVPGVVMAAFELVGLVRTITRAVGA